MGIDLLCGTKSFGCGYSDWNYVRTQILLATFIYLEQKIKDDTIITENYTENAAINRHDFYTNVISVLITKIAAQNETKFDLRIFMELKDSVIIDGLIFFGVGGLFTLSNNSDCEGFYTPGNSYDICNLLDIIKNILKEKFGDAYNIIYETYNHDATCIYDLFKESMNINENIIIT